MRAHQVLVQEQPRDAGLASFLEGISKCSEGLQYSLLKQNSLYQNEKRQWPLEPLVLSVVYKRLSDHPLG